jgi:hypothetical protein
MDGPLRASPEVLAFEQTWVGARKTLPIEIANAGRTSRALEVTSEGEFFEGPAKVELGGGDAQSVLITFAPMRGGAFAGRVVLRDANGQPWASGRVTRAFRTSETPTSPFPPPSCFAAPGVERAR